MVKGNREQVQKVTLYCAVCEATIEKDSWSVLLKIQMELICDLYMREPLNVGDSFTCNFYKTSEDPSIEHYASFAPIGNRIPDFHLPQFFAQAIIVSD